MNELFFQTSAEKSLSFTDYEIITKMIIPLETLLQIQVADTVNMVSCPVKIIKFHT
jgi:hypothetical protein